jgi:hypothetical protein
MADTMSVRAPRMRELVFALCTAWLLMQNVLLLLWLAWQPLTGVRIAALALVRVAIRAAAPVTVLPGTGILDVARLLLAAGTGATHV